MKYSAYKKISVEQFKDLRIMLRGLTLDKLKTMAKEDPSKLVRIKGLVRHSYVLFLELVKVSWNTKDIPDTHVEVYDLYDQMKRKEFTNLNLVVYRGYAKSSIKRNVSIRDILFRDQKYILFVNETLKQSRADLASIKHELKTNPYIRFLFGDVSYADIDDKKEKEWNKDRTMFYVDNDVSSWVAIEVYGMTSPIRGLNVNGIRPTRVFLDDFESERNSSTSDGRESVRDKIRKQILPIGQVGEFDIIFQGTIIHPKAWLNEVKYDFENNIIGAFNNKFSRYFERAMSTCPDTYGVGTWEELHSKEYWQIKRVEYQRDNEHWKFLQEYYNIPRQSGAPSFKSELIRANDCKYKSYKNLQWLEYSDGSKIACNVFVGVDPAYAFTARADDTCITTIAMLPNKDVVILDMIVEKIDMADKLAKMFMLGNQYEPRLFNIEAFGAALELPQAFEKEMWTKKKRWKYETFKEKVGKSNKFLNGLSPYVNAGQFSYVIGCKNIDLLKFQMQSFSGEERYHDDTIDGLFLAYQHADPPPRINVDERLANMKARDKNKNKGYNPYDEAMAFMNKDNKSNGNNIRSWRK